MGDLGTEKAEGAGGSGGGGFAGRERVEQDDGGIMKSRSFSSWSMNLNLYRLIISQINSTC